MRRLAPAAALCAGLLGVSCGSDEGKPAGRPVTVPANHGVRLEAREYSFAPAKVVVVGARGKLRIALEHRGSLPHNVRVFRGPRELGGTPTFQGRRAKTATLRLAPGRYRFACTVGDHARLGMRGLLELRR